MVPVFLQEESFCGSAEDCVAEGLVEKTLWPKLLSLERKPAILPADGASLNLVAERCSIVRGGVLDKQKQNHSLRITEESFVSIYNHLPCRLVCSSCVETLNDGEAVHG